MIQPSFVPARQRARRALREAFLEAAEQVFAEAGFEGATMAAIAARAGYSAGHLYNVFENKRALFREVLSWRASLAVERLSTALEAGKTLGHSLELFVHACLSFFQEHRLFFVLYIQETSGLEWNLRRFEDESVRVQRIVEQALGQRIERAATAGELPSGDPLVGTCTVLGALHHYLTRWIRSAGSNEELWAYESAFCAAFRRALGIAA
jgi:AcrR family transcriptional regulator